VNNTGVLKTLIVASLAAAALGFAATQQSNSKMLAQTFVDASTANSTEKTTQAPSSYIIQGAETSFLSTLVSGLGGQVSREFPIINAISATLTPSQAELVSKFENIEIQDDHSVQTMGKKFAINNNISVQTGADILHKRGFTGQGVAVAVIDSGSIMGGNHGKNLLENSFGNKRNKIKYNAIEDREFTGNNDDYNGHGTHVTGIIASSLKSEDGHFNGIAPDVDLVSIKAFDENGASTYSIVLEALNWLYDNHDMYNVRVLNLSLGATVRSNYWDDPINQAVMKLWDAGIVVVTSAGNTGSKGMGSITVPGNTPYVITVGAATDNGSPYDFSDDRIASFSSIGPTFEGFVKPEVLAWGGSLESKVRTSFSDTIKVKKSEKGEHYAVISGTSQASAVVSGIAALILQRNGHLSPDDVKCRIIASAQTANNGDMITYSPFEQGHGLANAYAAVYSDASGCANIGMDIKKDLEGTQHYAGPTALDANGDFIIVGKDGSVLNEGNQWADLSVLSEGNQWGDLSVLSEGNQWGDLSVLSEGNQWGDLSVLSEGNQWGDLSILTEGNQWGDLSVITNGVTITGK
jgi:serine protease AprX